MKFVSHVFLLIISIQLVLSCPDPKLKLNSAQSFTPPDTAYVLTQEQSYGNTDGKLINIHPGDDFIIQLKSNPGGTGYSWQFTNTLQEQYASTKSSPIQYQHCSYRHPVQADSTRQMVVCITIISLNHLINMCISTDNTTICIYTYIL